jgi:Spy/CpxP family protein refolding chaperone
MKTRSLAALLALLACGALPAAAQPGPPHGHGGDMMGGGLPGPPAFLSHVFPPRLVMEHQQEIGLKPAQADAIKQAMTETQQKLLDLQWRLDAESEALAKLLSTDHVDEATALTKLDQVTAIEQQVKRTNFSLLVKIKNQLDPGQQEKLRALRPASRFGGGPPRSGP